MPTASARRPGHDVDRFAQRRELSNELTMGQWIETAMIGVERQLPRR